MKADITVADIDAMSKTPGAYAQCLRRYLVAQRGKYIDFIDQLYVDLDSCINGLRTIVEQVQDDGEDRLTADLILQLRQQGYSAHHDAKAGGHVDLSVASGPHTWIGEAKLNWKIDEGMKQLTTRYVAASGDPNHDHGGLLFYLTKSADAKATLDKWRKQLESESTPCRDCPTNRLAFYSTIKLPGTGLPYQVRSMAVSLYFKPQDASGKATATRRDARKKSAEKTTKKVTAK